MNRGGYDLKTTNYGEHFTFCNPEMTSETCAFFLQIAGIKAENLGIINLSDFFIGILLMLIC